jgi:hypothetical protein
VRVTLQRKRFPHLGEEGSYQAGVTIASMRMRLRRAAASADTSCLWDLNLSFQFWTTLACGHSEVSVLRDDPKPRCSTVKVAKGLGDVCVHESRGRLSVGRIAQYSLGNGVLPVARCTEANYQLPEGQVRMVKVSFVEGDQLVGEVAGYPAKVIAATLEMLFLCNEQVTVHRGPACIIELLRIGLGLPL